MTAGKDKTIRIWDRKKQITVLHVETACVLSLALTRNDRYLFSRLGNGRIVVWDLCGYQKVAVIEDAFSSIEPSWLENEGYTCPKISCVELSRSKQAAVVCYQSGHVQAWAEGSSKIVCRILMQQYSAVICADEKYAVIGSWDYTFVVVKLKGL